VLHLKLNILVNGVSLQFIKQILIYMQNQIKKFGVVICFVMTPSRLFLKILWEILVLKKKMNHCRAGNAKV
jgi:hypothetical protein